MHKGMYVVIGIGFLVVLSIIGNADRKPDDPNRLSVGYLDPGQCMSGAHYNEMSQAVVDRTDWSKIAGSATFSNSTKTLIGSIKVFDEMKRLGTAACPDLNPLYQKYLAASSSQQAAAPTDQAAKGQQVRLKQDGNLRRGPSTTNPVIRIVRQGEVLRDFGRTNQWVQVGQMNPEGWIAESLVTPVP